MASLRDLFDFCQRLDHRKVSRRVLEPLIRSGAMDVFGVDRSRLWISIDNALKLAEQHQQNRILGQGDLFAQSQALPQVDYGYCAPWGELARLQGEKRVLGIYFSGHPLRAFEQELTTLNSIKIDQLEKSQKGIICSGLLVQLRIINTRKGMRMAVVTLEDSTGRIDVTIFSKLYEQVKGDLHADQIYLVRGQY